MNQVRTLFKAILLQLIITDNVGKSCDGNNSVTEFLCLESIVSHISVIKGSLFSL